MHYLCLAYGAGKDWLALSERQRSTLLAQDDVMRRRGDLVAAVDRSAVTVRAWDGVPTVADGGATDPPVPLAGFYVIEAEGLEEAIELVARTPCARAHGMIEVRAIASSNIDSPPAPRAKARG